MRLCRLFVVCLLLSIQPIVHGETPASLYQRGVEAFRQENWELAISSWQEIERQGNVSGELYYNLGNAYYRMGAVGRSIAYYERARKLLPRDSDIRQNLELARMATVDRVERPVRLMVWDWVDKVRDGLSLSEIARIVISLSLLTAASLAWWRFSPLHTRRVARMLTIVFAGLLVVSGAWLSWRSVLDSRQHAVVVEAKVDVFSAPDTSAKQVFTLHEGTTVRERQEVSGWIQIVLTDGRSGWLRAETLESI